MEITLKHIKIIRVVVIDPDAVYKLIRNLLEEEKEIQKSLNKISIKR